MPENRNDARILPSPVNSQMFISNFYTMHIGNYGPGYVYFGERHDFWELSCAIDGSFTVTYGDKFYECKKSDVLFYAPDVFHNMRVGENENCRILTASFDIYGIPPHVNTGRFRPDGGETFYFDKITDELDRAFGKSEYADYLALYKALPVGDVSLQIIKDLFELSVFSLMRSDGAAPQPWNDVSVCYAKIFNFLRRNVENNIKIEDICRGVYESPTKVKEVFRVCAGGGVMQYYNRMRCTHIEKLLAEGKTVKEISETMNFSSPYYLSYFFKRQTGMTVREYIKSRRGGK